MGVGRREGESLSMACLTFSACAKNAIVILFARLHAVDGKHAAAGQGAIMVQEVFLSFGRAKSGTLLRKTPQ